MFIKGFTLLFLLSLSAAVAQAQIGPEPVTLIAGQTIEREIAGGESHAYQISLTAGQFARFRLEQRAIDAALNLTAPDGKQLIEMNLTGLTGAGEDESVSVVASTSGIYRIIVHGTSTDRSRGAGTVRGSYRLWATGQPSASANDRQRITAESLLAEAAELRRQRGKTLAGTEQARRIAEQIVEKTQQALPVTRELNEPALTAYALFFLASAYLVDIDQPDKAIEYSEQAAAIFRELKLYSMEGDSLRFLSSAYSRQGHAERSLEYQERALGSYRVVTDRWAEGVTLSNLGVADTMMGRYEKAIQNSEQSAAIFRELKIGNREGMALVTLGRAYLWLGRLEKTVEYYEQALALNRETKNRVGEGNALNNLGEAYNLLGSNEKAIEYHEQALAIYREAKYRFGEGTVLNDLGVVYYGLGRFDKAIEFYEPALVIRREIKAPMLESETLLNLGDANYALGRFDEAVKNYEEGLILARNAKARSREAKALYGLATTERTRGNLIRALSLIEESVEIAESVRADLASPESRTAFLATVQASYQLYIDMLMSRHQKEPTKGFDALAVEVSEQQRGRSLLDLLAEARADVRQGVDPALLEHERSLGRRLNDKAQFLTQANKPEQANALKKEIGQLENDYERAQADIRKASPHYAALTQPKPLKLKEIQAQLDPDTLLLEYSLGADRSYLWAITKDSLKSYELPKEDLIKRNALQVYDMLAARNVRKQGETALQKNARIAEADAKLPVAAQELSRTLLSPVSATLGNKRLVIVADGALQYIPFAMLPDPAAAANQPLIVNHEVVSLPSASAIAIQRSELAGRNPAPNTLAVIADPVFDRSDKRFKTAAPEMTDEPKTFEDTRGLEHIADAPDSKTGKLIIRRLPFTRQEADGLLALAPKNSTFRATDFQASRENVLKGDLAKYRYVHFATHGLLDTERPGLSSLVLSTVDADGKAQDGFLRANDIYNMKLPAELVVLSACQTGLGKEVKGEGLIGLTRGFMYAGAKRVVVSLWSVNDKATSDLMTQFYRGMLKDNDRPAAALRAAQIEMWKQKKWQSPYYWAAFTMQGEWR